MVVADVAIKFIMVEICSSTGHFNERNLRDWEKGHFGEMFS